MKKIVKIAVLGLMPLSMLAVTGAAFSQEVVIEEPYYDVDPDAGDDVDTIVVETDDAEDEGEVILTEDDAVARCAETFRSFNARTGTYTGYDGRRCPYL